MNADNQDHRLSVLWKVRRQSEDACRMAFESARTQADSAEVYVRRLRNLLEVHTAEARSVMLNDPATMARYRQSAAELGAALVDATRFLAEARLKLERRRAELEEAMRQRKAAEALQQREATAAAAAQNRQENRTSEELHAARSAAETTARP